MKKIIYSFIIFVILFINDISLYASDFINFGYDKVDDGLKSGSLDLVTIIDNTLLYLVGLLYFISVVFIVYSGFIILTSIGDEEKVKKGRNILIYAIIGLIVIFLASNIVNWINNVMTDEDIVGELDG